MLMRMVTAQSHEKMHIKTKVLAFFDVSGNSGLQRPWNYRYLQCKFRVTQGECVVHSRQFVGSTSAEILPLSIRNIFYCGHFQHVERLEKILRHPLKNIKQ